MTSVVIPGLDLVPSLPSRVVTVDLVDMTEGQEVAGAKIDFFLPADLHVPADDKILQAGRVTLTLNASGHGEIRLPAYTDTVRPVDWVIGVKKHWAPHPYYIRVPAGSTRISLADITAVQTLPQGVVDWMITGASATVTEGAQWDADLSLAAGILKLDLTVPPGSIAFLRGTLPASTDLNTLRTTADAGQWTLNDTNLSTYVGLPEGLSTRATLEVVAPNAWTVTQVVVGTDNSVWRRALINASIGNWTPWKSERHGGALPANTDLRAIRTDNPAQSFQLGASALNSYLNAPPMYGYGTLEVASPGDWAVTQRVTDALGTVYESSIRNPSTGVWNDWATASPGPSSQGWTHWGDSQTDTAHAGAANAWVTQLSARTGQSHLNEGWSGQTAHQIAARQGSLPVFITLQGDQIPTSAPVKITSISTPPTSSNNPSRFVEGTLAGRRVKVHTDSTGTHWVTALGGAAPSPCPPRSRFTPATQAASQRPRIVTIWAGANSALSTPEEDVLGVLDSMISYHSALGNRRILVMQLLMPSNAPPGGAQQIWRTRLNDLLASTFPSLYLPVGEFLQTNEAEVAAGISFTPEDLSDISNGWTPRSFRVDYAHLNAAGCTAVSELVFATAQRRGWL